MVLPKFLPLLLAVATATPTTVLDVLDTEIREATGKERHELIGLNKAAEELKTLYTSQHDIVNIIVPLTRYNVSICNIKKTPPYTTFFVETDINDKGERTYQGLFVLKNGTATKIVDNGRDATALNDGSNKVYIGASDGIYIYDDIDGTTKKYGNLNDNIIQVEADNQAGVIFFVTNDHEVYFITDEATKKHKIEDLKDVKEIAIDISGNIFYCDSNNDLYVFNQAGIKKIEGIPKQRGSNIRLTTMFPTNKATVIAIVDDKMYALKSDGGYTNHKTASSLKNLTAYAPDTGLIQLFASDKKIYEFDGIRPFCTQLNILAYLSLFGN